MGYRQRRLSACLYRLVGYQRGTRLVTRWALPGNLSGFSFAERNAVRVVLQEPDNARIFPVCIFDEVIQPSGPAALVAVALAVHETPSERARLSARKALSIWKRFRKRLYIVIGQTFNDLAICRGRFQFR